MKLNLTCDKDLMNLGKYINNCQIFSTHRISLLILHAANLLHKIYRDGLVEVANLYNSTQYYSTRYT